MIHYVKGDLRESDCDILIHGCNCFNVWGAGIARQMKLKYPEAYIVDIAATNRFGLYGKLGRFSDALGHDGKVILNLYSQYSYGRDRIHADYQAIRRGLEAIHDFIATGDVERFPTWPKVGMPRIGAGLAGGDWGIIEGIIKDIFDVNDIYIYDLA